MVNLVVYTAIFGGKDKLNEIKNPLNNVDYVCFTDDPTLKSSTWKVVFMGGFLDYETPRKRAKFFKVMPQEYLDEYKYSIWMDGNTYLRCNPWDLVYLLKQKDLCTFKSTFSHNWQSIEVEAKVCEMFPFTNSEVMKAQVKRYIDEGYPDGNGFNIGSLIIRKNTPEITKLNELWWKEICENSIRDQLSFSYCVWKLGIEQEHIQYAVNDKNKKNPYVGRNLHRRDI